MKEDVYKKRNGARGLLRVLVVLFVAVLSAMSIYARTVCRLRAQVAVSDLIL